MTTPEGHGAEKETTADEKLPYKPKPTEIEAIKAYWVAKEKRGPRLKVTVTRKNSAEISADHADPPTGTVALMRAIGTTDFDFYNGLIGQLVNASKEADASEAGTNFMLSVVKGIEPRDQIEAMLATSDGRRPHGVHDLRETPRARRQYPAAGQRPERLQQARQDVRRSNIGR